METVTGRALIDRHAVVLLDAYGVLVNAEGALPGAIEWISHLNQVGKSYFVLTNDASRLVDRSAERYQTLGLEIPADHIITSGSLLPDYIRAEGLTGCGFAVMGPPDSAKYVEAGGGHVVPLEDVTKDTIEAVVVGDEAGYPFLETFDHVLSVILQRLDAGLTVRLILPNPDLIYPKGPGTVGLAAGSIAQAMESAIALRYTDERRVTFQRLGKPYPAIFEAAYARTQTKDMVMLGDQLATDIRGAKDFGLFAALVEWGLTGPLPADLGADRRPHYLVESFGV